MGSGQALYRKAKKIIPGGTMLLSKRPEMFLPDHWPSYFEKAKGCRVWDLDGTEYIDMSIMGVGTNILGYGNPKVDGVVRNVIDKGNMSTLNCPEEVALAEQLVELHPWADMVRLARTGGEANAIAIRIARAASGRDKVAICGYHGWHDWYLSANLGEDDSLRNHLLPGLDPAGVPRNLKGSVVPFNYNDIHAVRQIIVENPEVGVLKMEVARNIRPAKGYLLEVREICTQNNVVLIFDECTSGFRETFGGLHKKYGVEPDICMFGKALGNGYAITAVVGRRSVMEAAQKTFISSTFWTERIGPSAALATLAEMKMMQSWDVITNTGKRITDRWKALGEKYGLKLSTAGLPSLTFFSIDSADWLKYKTYITQEMLKRGFLAANSVYVSTMHTEDEVNLYFENLEDIFIKISDFEQDKENVDNCLTGDICQSGFNRLN